MIPVVYSSFTTFYNPKKNLFTSGRKETLQRRGRCHLRVCAEQQEPCWQMCGGSSNAWHRSLGWVNSGKNAIKGAKFSLRMGHHLALS